MLTRSGERSPYWAPQSASASAPISASAKSCTIARSRSGLACSSCLRSQLESSIVVSTTVLLLARLGWTSRGWRGGQLSRALRARRRRLARFIEEQRASDGARTRALVHHERGRYSTARFRRSYPPDGPAHTNRTGQ